MTAPRTSQQAQDLPPHTLVRDRVQKSTNAPSVKRASALEFGEEESLEACCWALFTRVRITQHRQLDPTNITS